MDTTSLKTTAFGGYVKESVHDLLEELSLSYSVKLSQLSEEKGELVDKLIVLEKELASLKETLDASEKERLHVANAIVSAEKEAAKLLANAALEAEEITAKAVSEAELLRANTRNELKEEFDKLKDLRISTLQAMTSYKDKLDAISKRLGADL